MWTECTHCHFKFQVDDKHSLEQIFQSFGFVPIETPHLEYDEILVGAGEKINRPLA